MTLTYLDISNGDLLKSGNGVDNLSESLFLNLSSWEHFDVGEGFSDIVLSHLVHVQVVHHLFQEVLVVGGGHGGVFGVKVSHHLGHGNGPFTVVPWLVSVWVESLGGGGSIIVDSLFWGVWNDGFRDEFHLEK